MELSCRIESVYRVERGRHVPGPFISNGHIKFMTQEVITDSFRPFKLKHWQMLLDHFPILMAEMLPQIHINTRTQRPLPRQPARQSIFSTTNCLTRPCPRLCSSVLRFPFAICSESFLLSEGRTGLVWQKGS